MIYEVTLFMLLVIVSAFLLLSSWLDKKHRRLEEGRFDERLRRLEEATLPSISAAPSNRDMFSAPLALKDCSTRDAFSEPFDNAPGYLKRREKL